MCLVSALLEAHSHLKGVARSAVPDPIALMITLPAFFLWIPISLIVGNIVLYCVPPLRQVAQRHAAQANRPGFLASQKVLLRVLGVLALVCLPLIVLGFFL